MRWTGVLLVVLAASAAPAMLPPGTFRAAWVPDVAALACVHVAFRGTPDRAALLGVAIGLASSPWRPEPAPWLAFLHGATAYLTALVASGLVRDGAFVRMIAAAAAVLVLRGGALLAAAVSDTEPLGAGGAACAAATALLAALCAGCAAPPFAALARRWRLLAPLERSFRDV